MQMSKNENNDVSKDYPIATPKPIQKKEPAIDDISRDGAVVRALISHLFVPGSIPGPGVI